MHEAVIAKLTNVRPHGNADRLQLATVAGHQIVVGLENTEGQLGVFFYSELQLSPEYADANDLVGYTDPETGERRGGYFAKNRRVRAQRLRGEKSEGYWAELDSLAWTGFDLSLLKEGDKFKELNGHPICEKYFTPATLKAIANRKAKRSNVLFKKHVDTRKLQYEIGNIPEGSILYLSEKVHGTSGRFGYVLDEVEKPRRWWQKLLRRKPKTEMVYDHLIGTRNVILGKHEGPSFYGNEEFRYESIKNLEGQLHKGEILYYEIVGYTTTGQPLMESQPTKNLQDKTIRKTYGDMMHYSYGQVVGHCEIYVYRITRTNEDGDVVELPWPQVKARCNELGVKYVPEFAADYQPHVYKVFAAHSTKSYMDQWNLEELVAQYIDGPSTLDGTHIREGVVVRIEKPNGETEWYKAKSFTFGVLEGFWKEQDDAVDLEEIS